MLSGTFTNTFKTSLEIHFHTFTTIWIAKLKKREKWLTFQMKKHASTKTAGLNDILFFPNILKLVDKFFLEIKAVFNQIFHYFTPNIGKLGSWLENHQQTEY